MKVEQKLREREKMGWMLRLKIRCSNAPVIYINVTFTFKSPKALEVKINFQSSFFFCSLSYINIVTVFCLNIAVPCIFIFR